MLHSAVRHNVDVPSCSWLLCMAVPQNMFDSLYRPLDQRIARILKTEGANEILKKVDQNLLLIVGIGGTSKTF